LNHLYWIFAVCRAGVVDTMLGENKTMIMTVKVLLMMAEMVVII
jgi:hypothetical protein